MENKFEQEAGMETGSGFRGIVGRLIENSTLFPPKTIGDKKLTILDAIEQNEITLYVPEHTSDRMLDAVNCLTAVYEELKKVEPDQEFIAGTVAHLKEYL